MSEIIESSSISVTRALACLRHEGIVTAANGVVPVISRDTLLRRLDRLP